MNNTTNTALQIVIGLLFTFVTITSIALASNEEASNAKKSPEATNSVGGDIVAENVNGEAKQ